MVCLPDLIRAFCSAPKYELMLVSIRSQALQSERDGRWIQCPDDLPDGGIARPGHVGPFCVFDSEPVQRRKGRSRPGQRETFDERYGLGRGPAGAGVCSRTGIESGAAEVAVQLVPTLQRS